MKDYLNKIVSILFGSIIIASGINFFLVPFRILDGGIIGLSLIINYLTGLKVGLMIILLSIPIYLFCWFKYRGFFYNSIFGMLISSFFIDVLYPYQFYFMHYVKLSSFASSIIGGILIGLGIGIMLKANTSISGVDMLAKILSNILNINVGIIIYIFDLTIILLGGFLISLETFYLSIITITAVGMSTILITMKSKQNLM